TLSHKMPAEDKSARRRGTKQSVWSPSDPLRPRLSWVYCASLAAAPRGTAGPALPDRTESDAERWPSGRRRTPGKCVGGEPSQGFESLSLRHLPHRPINL